AVSSSASPSECAVVRSVPRSASPPVSRSSEPRWSSTAPCPPPSGDDAAEEEAATAVSCRGKDSEGAIIRAASPGPGPAATAGPRYFRSRTSTVPSPVIASTECLSAPILIDDVTRPLLSSRPSSRGHR
ncbi:unnamed protein product, partial [Ectocarpus sp. 4 AP-2014]